MTADTPSPSKILFIESLTIAVFSAECVFWEGRV
jgi:hypothetical protein